MANLTPERREKERIDKELVRAYLNAYFLTEDRRLAAQLEEARYAEARDAQREAFDKLKGVLPGIYSFDDTCAIHIEEGGTLNAMPTPKIVIGRGV